MPEAIGPAEIEALRKQDAAAFTRLVRAHQGLVLGLCQSMGLRGADIDDAAAEAFAAVFRALPGFRGEAALSTWVYRIALRRIVAARRRLKAAGGAALPEVADPRAEWPGGGMEAREASAALWAAVAALEPAQVAAVEMHYRRGWPLGQIAEVMECPVGTVKTHLFRAREKLRHLLGPLENEK